MTVAIAESQELVRAGFRSIVDAQPGFDVVATATEPGEIVPTVHRVAPDVLLCEICFDGAHAFADILSVAQRTGVVVITGHREPDILREVMRLGARGYVHKDAAVEVLYAAIRHTACGGRFIDPSLGWQLANVPVESEISDREREVLWLIAAGHTAAEVADRLYLSKRTVEAVRSTLRTKLGLRTRAELYSYARSRGLLAIDCSGTALDRPVMH